MKTKNKKISLIFILFIVLAFTFFIILSPYKSDEIENYKLIKETVIINAPISKVHKYLGNSNNASNWSSFIDHITVLNSKFYKDGDKGSIRRCYQNADEKGTQWDELITINATNKRQLIIYNLKNFALTAENLATEQVYVALNNKKCSLTLTVFYKEKDPTLLNQLKLYLASYRISPILKKNLKNIKDIIEDESFL